MTTAAPEDGGFNLGNLKEKLKHPFADHKEKHRDSPAHEESASKSEQAEEEPKHHFAELREKLHHSSLHDIKVNIIHKKHELGKLENLFNPNHRHDEAHEKRTDEKRTRIAQSHRFESFAPEREGNDIKWYVDGRDYYYAVSTALDRAKETIYIADWWLSPELFLRRPPFFNQEWRLDQILKRKAEAGVKIFVIVYREVEAAITCNSLHTKHALQALCPEGNPGHGNITVMRHPDHNVFENAADMTFYWAHHEKFIVIDYNVAFIGGLDLCFGRWDNHQHQLADVHPGGVTNEIWPGQDFNNNRVMDFQKVDDWKSNELSKAEYGRMPWHDVAMGVIGDCVYDIAEHFVLRWNFIKRDKYKRAPEFDWIMMPGRTGEDEDLVGVQRPRHPVGNYIYHPLSPEENKLRGKQGTVHAQIVRSSADWSSGILTEHSIQNAYQQLIREAEHYIYIENQFFITATGEHQLPVKNTIGRAIVDAVARAAHEGRKFRVIILIPAIPGFAGDLRDDAATGTRAIMGYQYKSICRGEHSIYGQLNAQGIDATKYIFFFNLRSYDRLNYTPRLKQQEKEAGVTYQQAQRAEAEEIMGEGIHGSKDDEGGADTHMGRDRIGKDDSGDEEAEKNIDMKRKFEEKRKDGSEEPNSLASADSVAKDAMLGVGKVSDEPWEGTDEEEVDLWVQEELYIHGKTMIIDDRTVICGSSNLNDRSQLGIHDSELSIVMQDTKPLQSKMNGQDYEAGYHAATLRRYLWREHLGLLPPQEMDASKDINAQPVGDSPNDVAEGDTFDFVADPLSDEVWDMWTSRAAKNTHIFRELFHTDPDDHIKNFEQYNQWLPAKGVKAGHIYDRARSSSEIRAKLDGIQGHLVDMPLKFLEDVEMAEFGLQVNSYTESVYT